MSDSDLISLYSGPILALAANIPLTGRLASPGGSAKKRSPACGSTVTVDLVLQDGIVSGYAQEVRACALGQASAAILGRVVVGRSLTELQEARDAVAAMLQDASPPPPAPFEQYALLIPARDFRNRHASILLVLDAACDAAAQAAEQARQP
ncbi:iron-sulfur cluster assembly scaffold protein [Pseudogemmobacter bohemicus]|uniref:iron-sulfur cluster assembly scaffold protein n=1 Tax=Pseudogemmobacter bohemicus TaxID=2250708 RepID=UPI000DD342E6|nr:iron-sulfur cluster assembly scaffold protein [Pseudogemmobacter bohemicus]